MRLSSSLCFVLGWSPRSEKRLWSRWSDFEGVMGGLFRGNWSTYDEIGALRRSVTGAKVDVAIDGLRADHSLDIDGKTMAVGTYTPENLNWVVTADGAAVGPTLLRNGLVSTELVLKFDSARARITIQHAPALSKDQSAALKIFKVTVARELSEEINPHTYWHPATPFDWRKKWLGTTTVSTKTDSRTINTEFSVEEEYWHNVRSGDADYTLAQGNLLIQAPTIILPGRTALPFRVAWLPTENTLLRAEVLAALLTPDESNDTEDIFLPPRLLTLQVDSLTSASS